MHHKTAGIAGIGKIGKGDYFFEDHSAGATAVVRAALGVTAPQP